MEEIIKEQFLNENDESIEKSSKKKEKKLKENIPFEQELLRKGIHLVSLNIPVLYIFVSKTFALSILIPLCIVFVTIDILSKKNQAVSELVHKYFGGMLRKHEKKKKRLILNGASWVLISAVITVLVFPKIVAVVAFTILIISDMSAALIGRKFGKTKLFNKSLEGTTAFIVSALIVVSVIGFFFDGNWLYYLAGGTAAFVGGIVEAYSKKMKVDDNMSIPASVGIVMLLIDFIFDGYGASFLNMM
jgi:dolichol kinase